MFRYFFFFKQKTAYEVRISDWSSDVCSSDLLLVTHDHPKFFAWSLEQLVQDKWNLTELSFDLHDSELREEYKIMTTSEKSWLAEGDRKSVVQGKSVSVRVDLGGHRIIKKNIVIAK